LSFRSKIVVALALTPLLLPGADTVLKGRVHDLAGRPLKNVAITAAGGPKTFSGEDGEFSIAVPGAVSELRVRFESPGFYPETIVWDRESAAPLDVPLTPLAVVREGVRVVASRLDVPLAVNPAATTVVAEDKLEALPRGIGAEEALRGVPGVKVDNQANGERVHLSIRGQGILTERGIRGIQVLYDGIPLNDPTGFVPDLFDVDWGGVREVDVVRGPVAFLYGGGSAGGVIDIHSNDPALEPVRGELDVSGGSNAFYKTRGEVTGTVKDIAYLVSGSRTAGDGYRDHTAFWANNVYGKISFRPTSRLRLNPFIMGTGFFNQNAEGLNLAWLAESWRKANPDAITFNEYQRTIRTTGGLTGQYEAAENQLVSFTFYTRRTGYKEPVPSSVNHRTYTAPGGSIQYALDAGSGNVRGHFSAGFDLDGQYITDYRHPNLGLAREGPELLSDQSIRQNREGGYLSGRLALGEKWTALLGLRFDRIGNTLEDHLKANGLNLSGSRDFTRATGRVGLTYAPAKQVSLYASWGQGFLPPATEELYANPDALGGFNNRLVPATSQGEEMGVRGFAGNRFFYDTAFFHLSTTNDFERYRIASRPLETFYGNAGNSSRYGLESTFRWLPVSRVTVTGAYTYSHFTYTDYNSNTFPGDLTGNWLPNSPRHQFSADATFEFLSTYFFSLGVDAFSKAYVDPTNVPYIDGYGLLNSRISKTFQARGTSGTIFAMGRNLTGKRYIAFTEPDPDGNSYQPGPTREVFGGIRFRF
jgi:iron complex outermembrane receptor protein